MAPEDNSTPLQTMSYWIAFSARILSWSLTSSLRNSSAARLGMENGLWEKSIFFSSSFHSYIGKSTIQQNSKRVLSRRPSSSPIFVRAAPASFAAEPGLSAAKNKASPALTPAFAAIFCCTAAGMNFDRTFAAVGLVDNVAEPRRAHVGARPFVELVEKRARLRRRPRRRDRARDAALLDDVLERLELDVVAGKFIAHVGDHDRVAQVRLVGAVFQHRFGIGDARKFLGHRLAAGKLLKHAAQHGLHRREHVVLGDEAHLDVELIEFAGRAVGARVLVAKAG